MKNKFFFLAGSVVFLTCNSIKSLEQSYPSISGTILHVKKAPVKLRDVLHDVGLIEDKIAHIISEKEHMLTGDQKETIRKISVWLNSHSCRGLLHDARTNKRLDTLWYISKQLDMRNQELDDIVDEAINSQDMSKPHDELPEEAGASDSSLTEN